MALPSTFDYKTTQQHLQRLDKLTNATPPRWGKMNAAQMLAHLNVTYDLAYEQKKMNTNFFSKLLFKLIVKGIVTGEKSYPRNVKDTENKGVAYFEGRNNQAFGQLTAQQWSNQFYKHIEHHFEQFSL